MTDFHGRCPTWPRARSAAASCTPTTSCSPRAENLVTPGPPAFDPRGVRPTRQGVRRLGDPPPPRARQRLRDRPARRARRGARRRRRHRLLHRQLPAAGQPSTRLDVDGYPSVEELARRRRGSRSCPVAAVQGDTRNDFAVAEPRRVTHVRLDIYPDGGRGPAARARRGPRPTRRCCTGTVDLAALENGGDVVGLQRHVLRRRPQPAAARPGPRHGRGLGERPPPRRRQRLRDRPARRRPARCGGSSSTPPASSATRPASVRRGAARPARPTATGEWVELLPRTDVQPDTRHVFPVAGAAAEAPSRTSGVDVYPDGGMARLRVLGELRS